MSQEASSEVIETALSCRGAFGYVFKSRVQTDLLPAIESVLAGRQFVSQELDLRQRSSEPNVQAPFRHEVLFYSEDAALIEHVAGFIAPALRNGNPAIVFATESHREALARKLKEEDIDLKGAIQKGIYISLDGAKLLSEIMVNGFPDGARFFKGLEDLIKSASEAAETRHPRTALCGECLGLLCAEGNTKAAIHFEKLAEAFLQTHEHVDFLCVYPLSAFDSDTRKDAYDSICRAHSAVRVR